jgi:hypothetical protein
MPRRRLSRSKRNIRRRDLAWERWWRREIGHAEYEKMIAPTFLLDLLGFRKRARGTKFGGKSLNVKWGFAS